MGRSHCDGDESVLSHYNVVFGGEVAGALFWDRESFSRIIVIRLQGQLSHQRWVLVRCAVERGNRKPKRVTRSCIS